MNVCGGNQFACMWVESSVNANLRHRILQLSQGLNPRGGFLTIKCTGGSRLQKSSNFWIGKAANRLPRGDGGLRRRGPADNVRVCVPN